MLVIKKVIKRAASPERELNAMRACSLTGGCMVFCKPVLVRTLGCLNGQKD